MTKLKHTPLYSFHQDNAARFVPFGEWEMPVQYSGIIEEHRKVRTSAGMFDVSHMGEARVRGRDAGAYLNRVMSNDIQAMAPGRALYTMICNPQGGIVDDVIVYCLQKNKDYLICLNAGNTAKDLAWLQQEVDGYDCVVEDESPQTAQLAVQGPKVWEVVRFLDAALAEIPRFEFRMIQWQGIEMMVSRTGYTGEDGVEIYLPAEAAEQVAGELWQRIEAIGGCLAGLGARDSLRLEAGFPLYGHEIDDTISPLEAGLGWTVAWDKPGGFIGQEALQAEKERGRRRRLIHFIVNDRRIPRQGSKVLAGDEVIGSVASGTQSPMLNLPIGSALIDHDGLGKGELVAEVRQKPVALEVVKPPLHKRKK